MFEKLQTGEKIHDAPGQPRTCSHLIYAQTLTGVCQAMFTHRSPPEGGLLKYLLFCRHMTIIGCVADILQAITCHHVSYYSVDWSTGVVEYWTGLLD